MWHKYTYIDFLYFCRSPTFCNQEGVEEIKTLYFLYSLSLSVWSPGRWWRTFHLRVSSVKTFSPAYRCVWVFFFTSYRRLTTMWDCGSIRWTQSLTVWEIITFIDHKKDTVVCAYRFPVQEAINYFPQTFQMLVPTNLSLKQTSYFV